MPDRIDELEARFTLQERQINELSEVLWAQQRQLDQLQRLVGQLEEKLGGDAGLVDAKADEKPPHY